VAASLHDDDDDDDDILPMHLCDFLLFVSYIYLLQDVTVLLAVDDCLLLAVDDCTYYSVESKHVFPYPCALHDVPL